MEQDKRRLDEMKRFDPRFAKYSKENAGLAVVEAKRIEAAESSERELERQRDEK